MKINALYVRKCREMAILEKRGNTIILINGKKPEFGNLLHIAVGEGFGTHREIEIPTSEEYDGIEILSKPEDLIKSMRFKNIIIKEGKKKKKKIGRLYFLKTRAKHKKI